ncbi:Glucose/ribitol dehydrogenase, partial [Cynara cardunculus var. scolymus]
MQLLLFFPLYIATFCASLRCVLTTVTQIDQRGEKMATNGRNFPPQKQEHQPGLEHVMNPSPQFMNPNYKPAGKLQGKVALVTGGDSGIGRAVCYLFVKEGATVAFTFVKGREDKDADDTLRLLLENKTGDAKNPIAIAADLGFDENCKKVVDEVVENYGRIDILNSTRPVPLMKSPRIVWLGHALRYMNVGSSIINTTSVDAYLGNPELMDYASTKGAIVSFTRGLALQLAQKGIRVNGVAPGPVYTPIRPASMEESDVSEWGSKTPMGRAAQPHEISPSFVFLASDDSTYFTGQFLHPN